MVLRTIILFAAALSIANPSDKPVPPTKTAQAYFQQALKLIKEHHRNRTQVDWAELGPCAQVLLAGAKSPSDTYQAIRFILDALQERHSFLVELSALPAAKAGGTTGIDDKSSPKPSMPSSRIVQNRFGYLHLPELNTLGSNGPALGVRYTSLARDALLGMDRADLCGWIIDLRGNGGGNMWPMLWGLDPLLGEPPFGFFVLPNSSKQAWIRSTGNIFPSPNPLPKSPPAFALKHSSAPIAVLIGPQTASSGEMTAIALTGRSNTRVFGTPSAGLTTANKAYPLTDGAVLILTETSVQDRNGKDYAGPIMPDEQLGASEAETGAQRWLASRCTRQDNAPTRG